MKLAPICLFTYNRLEETQQTIKALENNFLAIESELFVFSDGWKNEIEKNKILKVRAFLKTITGFKNVTLIESEKNKGLANSIIDGVTSIFEKHQSVIVLEDDLISTPNFLNFMNEALSFYKNSKKIQSINGYSLEVQTEEEVYFQQRTFSWGWGTWGDRWSKDYFDEKLIYEKIGSNESILKEFNNKCGNDIAVMLKNSLSGVNNSWYVRWAFSHFVNNRNAVYPTFSKIENIGFVSEGTNCKGINTFTSKLDRTKKTSFLFFNYKEMSSDINYQFLKYFKRSYRIIFRLKSVKTNPEILIEILKEVKDRFLLKLKTWNL